MARRQLEEAILKESKAENVSKQELLQRLTTAVSSNRGGKSKARRCGI